MTYKLNPAIGKIENSVVLVFPGGERRRYQNGADVVEVVLSENTEIRNSSWIGEEHTSFF